MKAHILMIADTAPPLYGGAGAQASLLAERLRSSGYRVDILARQKHKVTEWPAGTTFARPFVRNPTLSTLFFCVSVAIRVLASRASIVHVHGGYVFAFVAVMAARLRGKPSILKVTLLGSDDPETIARARFLGLPVGRIQVRQFQTASIVIAVNEQVRTAILRIVPQARVEVIVNGTEPVSAAVTPTSSPVVCYTGALSHRKGTDTLLKAWSTVRNRLPAATLRLVGPVHADMVDAIDDADALGEMGVTVEGLVSPLESRAAISQAAVFVLPSRQEGQPNALIEAMSAGLACCASDIPVNVATGGDAILTFPVGDPIELAKAIERAWNERTELSARAREQAKLYDIARTSELYRELYASLEGHLG